MQHHKWSLSDLDNLMPWERYVYIDLLQDYLMEEEKKARDKEQELKSRLQSLQRKRM